MTKPLLKNKNIPVDAVKRASTAKAKASARCIAQVEFTIADVPVATLAIGGIISWSPAPKPAAD